MKKRILALSLGLMMGMTALVGCAPAATLGQHDASQSVGAPATTITSATSGTTQNILSGDVLSFVQDYQINVAAPHSATYANGATLAKPTPVRLEWADTDAATHYTVKVSQKADMSEAKSYTVFQKYLDLDALYMGTQYYYQVYAHRADKVVKSAIFNFKTAHQPRLFDFETTHQDSNARDIGGHYTEDGTKRVKQGMVYRGAEIKHYTQEAKDYLLYNLGIQTELAVHAATTPDLTGVPNYVYTKGPHYVEWYGIAFYGEQNKDDLKNEILVFAEPSNYPVFFHCQLGRDRTGTLAFLLSALLGVSKQDIFMDYELSYLTQYGGNDFLGDNCPETKVYQFEAMYQYINNGSCVNYSKETLTNQWFDSSATTLADRTAAYLKGCLGITDEQISAIRNNLLEEV